MEDQKKSKFKLIKLDRFNIRRQAAQTEKSVVRHARKFIVKRWENVAAARTQLVVWSLLVLAVFSSIGFQIYMSDQTYTASEPTSGGTYREAVIGKIENLNPLYASTEAEKSVIKLVFSSLYTYDVSGGLKGDLAKSMSITNDGKTYLVTIRDDVKWQDGKSLTANDVKFTLDLIKNSQISSAQSQTWKNVDVKLAGDYSIEFNIPTPYAYFQNALTFPVLPRHILFEVEPSSMRDNRFSRLPIGSGPFKVRTIQTIKVKDVVSQVAHLNSNENYYSGAPKLDRFEIHGYQSQENLLSSVESGDSNSASGISGLYQLSGSLVRKETPINNGVYAFFNVDRNLVKDQRMRQSIKSIIDLETSRQEFEKIYGTFNSLDYPILTSKLDQSVTLPSVQSDWNDVDIRNNLKELGYKEVEGKWKTADDQDLTLSIVTVKGADYSKFAELIADKLRDFGFGVQLQFIDINDPSQNFVLNTLRPRDYDILVYEIELGDDLDVFAYWHSSQKSNTGLNLSNYSNVIADDALRTSRGGADLNLRSLKYKTFIEEWVKDIPAIGLYQSNFIYIQSKSSKSYSENARLVAPEYRYFDVVDWMIELKNVYKTP